MLDMFVKVVLEAWFKERSNMLTECSKCKLSEEFEANGCKVRAKRKAR